MIITVACYRPDSEDYFRGHVNERQGSSFEICAFSSTGDAAKYVAARKMEDEVRKEKWVSPWEITIFKDGYPLCDPECNVHSVYVDEDRGDDVIVNQLKILEDAATIDLRTAYQEKLARDKQAEEVRKLVIEARARDDRRAKFEELKKEFGS